MAPAAVSAQRGRPLAGRNSHSGSDAVPGYIWRMKFARLLAVLALVGVIGSDPAFALLTCCTDEMAPMGIATAASESQPSDSPTPVTDPCGIDGCRSCARVCSGMPGTPFLLSPGRYYVAEGLPANSLRPSSVGIEPDRPPPRA